MEMRGHNRQAKSPVRTALVKWAALVLLVALAASAGAVSAAVFALNEAQNSEAGPIGVRLFARPDSSSTTATFPSAIVNVAPTYQTADVALSLFPSESNFPQPSTYYTNLLQIENLGKDSNKISSITV